jgi:pimeloyl-ACP methyl ester carboxylesterase
MSTAGDLVLGRTAIVESVSAPAASVASALIAVRADAASCAVPWVNGVLHYLTVEVNPCAMAINMSRANLPRVDLCRIRTLVAAIAVVAAGMFGGGPAHAASVTSENWGTRPDVFNRVLVMKPDQPAGAVMLLPGGHGNINLDAQSHIGWGEDDFLVRTRMRYANDGLLTIIPDVAADHKPPVSLAGFRTSPMQADDLQALADHLHGMAPKVWLVAYDSGATSALNAVARDKLDSIAGLVLISPILEPPDPDSTLLIDGAKRALGRMPVLVIGHQFDPCSFPVLDRIRNAAAALKVPNFQATAITGGGEQYTVSDPFEYPENSCNTQAHHALAGREAVVTRDVIDWIGRQSAAAK